MALFSSAICQNEWTCPICTVSNTIHTYPLCTVCFNSMGFPDDKSMVGPRRSIPRKIITYQQMKDVHIPCMILESSKSIFDHDRQCHSEFDFKEAFKCIIQYCQEFRTHFVDDQFPPIERSVSYTSFPNVARWLRINDMSPLPYEDCNLAWTVFSTPLPSDIQQGALGNCWLVAALALVTEYPPILERILLTREVNQEGVYFVRICYNGLWRTVVVDDCFPCTWDGQLVFTKAKRRQLYVPLIEKACAKLFGNYAALRSGTLMEGLQLLTGAPCDFIDLEPSDRKLDGDIVWAKLVSACESKLLIGVSTSSRGMYSEEYRRIGIPQNHAFSILSAHQMASGHLRYVLVRDPHGSSAYQEPFLTADCLEILRTIHSDDRSSGAFWICWPSFLRYFSAITISTYKSNHFDIRKSGQFTQSATDQHQIFQIKINQTSSINISLVYHRPDRSTRTLHIQSFILCDLQKSLSSNEYRLGKGVNLLISGRGGFTKWEGLLHAGTYILIPFSFSFWYDRTKSRNYTAVIHSNTEFQLRTKYTQASFLSDCLIASLLKYHDQKAENGETALYFKSKPTEVCMLMFENRSSSQYLAIDIDFHNEETKLFHSRMGHHIRDCIPPLNRQIIFLAEWKNIQDASHFFDYRLSVTHRINRSDPFPIINVKNGDLHTPRPM